MVPVGFWLLFACAGAGKKNWTTENTQNNQASCLLLAACFKV
jgi:hypothetical protein